MLAAAGVARVKGMPYAFAVRASRISAAGRPALIPPVGAIASGSFDSTPKSFTRVKLFGVESKLPLAIAPTGGISAGRPAAEILLARTAKAYGIPFTLATPAAASIERVAAEAGGRLWFQLYVVRDREFREKL